MMHCYENVSARLSSFFGRWIGLKRIILLRPGNPLRALPRRRHFLVPQTTSTQRRRNLRPSEQKSK